MMEARNVIIRHAAPCAMDEAPLGSLCLVKHARDMDLYLQINHDMEHPKWEYITNVLTGTDSHIIDQILEDRLKTI